MLTSTINTKDTLGHELNSDFDFGRYDSDRNSYIPNEYVTPDYQTPLSSNILSFYYSNNDQYFYF
ncbi:MAG: hypothetical protein IPK08_11630 [Bacteroidetes bacterium]|nr:hypothetical protein [Bacteroidota bacterium]